MGDLKIIGTGGIIEGNLGAAAVNVNLDSALLFDGTNDSVDCNDVSTLDGATDITLTCWIKPVALSGTDYFLSKEVDGDNKIGIAWDSDLLYFQVADDANAYGTCAFDDATYNGVWTHLALVFDGGATGNANRLKAYINGVEQTLSFTGTIPAQTDSNSADFLMAKFSSNYYNGYIADVKIYNTNLGQTDIQTLASKINYPDILSTGARHWWKINEGTGTDIEDYGAATDFDGTVSGATWKFDQYSVNVQDNSTTTDGTFTVTQGKVECLALTSLDFVNTNNDYLSIGDTNNASFGDASVQTKFSISAWINMDEATNFPIISKGIYNTNAEYKLHVDGADLLEFLVYDEDVNNCFQGVKYTTALAQNKWIHVVATSGATTESGTAVRGTMKLYVDGVQVNNDTSGSGAASYDAMVNGSAAVHIGRYDSTYANGSIRDVRIYEQELSADQVASLYSGSYNVNPLLGYKLDEGTGNASGFGTANAGGASDATVNGADWVNGTLDLDGTLTIAAEGTLSAPRGNLDLSDDLSVTGTFTHNNGKVRAMDTQTIQIQAGNATPLTFYNLEANTGWNSLRGTGGITVLNLLSATTRYNVIRPLDGNVSLTLGTDSDAGGLTGNAIQFTSNGTNYAEIKAASSLKPWTAETAPDFDSGGSGSKVRIADCDMDPDITTGGGGVTITLTGDCEFDAFVVSGNDTLDLNGQRATFGGGLFNNTGTLTDGGDNSLIHITGTSALRSYTGDSSTQWSFGHHNENPNMTLGNTDMIISGGAASIKMPSTANDFARTVLVSGSGAQKINSGVGFCPQNLIVASEVDTHGSNNNKIDTTNLTIPTGGTLTANASTLTVAGDFTTSGGLLGASCLDLEAGTKEFVSVAVDASSKNQHLKGAHTSGNATYECWLKAESDGGPMTPFMKGSEFAIRIDIGGQIAAATGSDYNWRNIGSSLGTHITVGKWHHLAMTVEPTTVDGTARAIWTIYIDGKAKAAYTTTTGGSTWSGNNNYVFIGRYSDATSGAGSQYWDGNIENFRMWNTKRTPAQIRESMFTAEYADGTSGLVEQWLFNEGTGTTVAGTNPTSAGTYEAGAGKYWDGDSEENWTGSDAGGWAGAGGYDGDSSELVMTGSGAKINYLADDEFGKLSITGTVSLNGVDSSSAALLLRGNLNFTGSASGTLASTGTEHIVLDQTWKNNGRVIGFHGSGNHIANLSKLRTTHTSGNIDIPACTTKRIFSDGNGTTKATGDLTITTELEVNSGSTFNGQNYAHTIELIDNQGAIAQNGGSITITSRIDGSTTASWDLQNCTITGTSGANWFRVAHESDCELVGGTFEGFLIKNHGYGAGGGSGITVIGSIVNCDISDDTHPNHLIQWHHTLDTQQLLDADEAGDDDLRLTKPALDNALELMTK